jgi:Protein of unknown function (DUF1573)
MKSLFRYAISFVALLPFLVACKPNVATDTTTNATGTVTPTAQKLPRTTLQFANDIWDFGKIKEGAIVEHVYEVKNTGREPLLITDCKASCGCTIPQWPKDPIAVGETGKIEVKFNSAHKGGEVSKAITVTANTEPEQNFLTLKGFVEASEEKKD